MAPRLENKKARYTYEILERVEAGLALRGTEVKSLRLGNASLDEAFARIDNDRATLHNLPDPALRAGKPVQSRPETRQAATVTSAGNPQTCG